MIFAERFPVNLVWPGICLLITGILLYIADRRFFSPLLERAGIQRSDDIGLPVANHYQNTHFSEGEPASFLETSLLYKVTRQVAQARSEEEVIQYLTDTLIRLPLVSLILEVKGDRLKIQVVTDPKTSQIEKNSSYLNLPIDSITDRLVENRSIYFEDISLPSEFEPILSILLRRGCRSAAFISILENGQLSRMLVFGAHDPTQISPGNLQGYLNLADVIGAILEKYHVMTKLEMRVSDLQILTGFSQVISVETDLNRLFRVLHQQAIQMFGPELEFAVALYSHRDNLIQFPYFYEEGHLVSIPPFPLGEGLTSILIQSRKPLLLADRNAVMSLSGKVLGRDAKSWMGIPLIYSGGVVGAVLIQDLDHENRFGEDDVNLFNTLAPQIAIAVRNADLFAETQDLLVKHRLLRQVSIAASSSTNLEDALLNVVSGLLNAKAAEQISILLLNEDGLLQIRASAGYEGTRHLEVRIALGQGISGQAAQEKRAIRVDDLLSDSRYISIESRIRKSRIRESGMRSELAVPILFSDEVIGVLNLESSQVAAFDENDQEIISALGSNLGGVIANIRLVSQIRQQIERERRLFEATSKIRRSADLETILETAAQEIGRATGARRARIHITAGRSLDSMLPVAGKNGKLASQEEQK